MTPFHKHAFSLAGGLNAPEATGSNACGWTVHGSGKRAPKICDIFSPKSVHNMSGIRDPAPPNSDSDTGSVGSNKSNRFAALQEDEKEEVSNATTDVLPIGEIPESIQEGAILMQPHSNNALDNIQVEVAEPEVEGGATPREEDPQPDGIASSKEADFVKAKSE